ncbi:beta-glucosidase [Ramlibacter tataouinensis]|uniref:Candidate b-glucosidase, Glycoside Hydrolase Family 3 n=1 Tax=Ramlibacter tataouinensis (strain ATCC BAA-407 / DSM 14655 / LMG 21543 / TTB310) TaxID=365046 RepID=F5XWD0_RAMTT|nr:glycoside hydrolase family 3 C-terminal domain-containing protein [Ramlibacter tataouinensis]AEG91700.1 candidate b-glucosidase, Glycoside Hydrolase Family 3 [Ramlibacter tataouinensis TTB310]
MKKFAVILGCFILSIMSSCGGSGDGGSETSGAANAPTAPTAPATTAGEGRPAWMNTSLGAAERTEALLAAMTLDQKLQQLYNLPVLNEELQDEDPPCEFQQVGRHIEGIPELHIPTFRFANGGTGIRGGDCLPEPTATALPSGVAAAANFDPEINFQWGQVLGAELRSWAHHSLWGPGLNLIRTPFGGRNHEYMSEDPYLTGVTATQQVRGIQSNGKSHATPKHFVGNESEYQQERWTAASRIPSRAMHELYLLPFEMTVRDGKPASIMCAFPHLNFEWACENEPLLQQTLRGRWGFDGYVVSDRRAMHSTVPSVRAGVSYELDFEPEFYEPSRMKAALEAGDITVADIDRLLRPRFLKMFEFGHFDEAYDAFLPRDLQAHAQVARKAADGSVVLLKNDGLLPLNPQVRSVALIGADWFAGQATMPPRSGDREEMTNVIASSTVTPRQGLENTLRRLGSSAQVTYNDGDVIEEAVQLATNADVVIVMVGDNPRETLDTNTPSLPSINGTNQDMLVPAILAANPNTVVVLKTQGSVLMPWLPQARALVEAWYPGQHDGDVVADILFGVTNPSGKLPVTFGNSANEAAYQTEAQYPGVREANGLGGGEGGFEPDGSPQLVTLYDENLELGYRWYEARNVPPVFPFGHGLSYTTFAYSNLRLATASPAPGKVVLTVDYTITNTGTRAGKEASQVYVTLPLEAGEPSKRLVGFRKVELQPGASQQVSVAIDCSASHHPFSYFQPANESDLQKWADGNWVTPNGEFVVHVGTSSAQTPLQSAVALDLASCTA